MQSLFSLHCSVDAFNAALRGCLIRVLFSAIYVLSGAIHAGR